MRTSLVSGALANKYRNGGGAWERLSYVTGLRRLGFDVYFVEQIEPAACVDAAGAVTTLADSVNLAWFRSATQSFLERVAANYDRVIERLLSLPVTAIHGEFYASNVLVQPTSGSLRVCPVDWETAAGPGLMDLAALASGSWTDEWRTRLVRAYQGGLAGTESIDEVGDDSFRIGSNGPERFGGGMSNRRILVVEGFTEGGGRTRSVRADASESAGSVGTNLRVLVPEQRSEVGGGGTGFRPNGPQGQGALDTDSVFWITQCYCQVRDGGLRRGADLGQSRRCLT